MILTVNIVFVIFFVYLVDGKLAVIDKGGKNLAYRREIAVLKSFSEPDLVFAAGFEIFE